MGQWEIRKIILSSEYTENGKPFDLEEGAVPLRYDCDPENDSHILTYIVPKR